jgi:hypothetical protein
LPHNLSRHAGLNPASIPLAMPLCGGWSYIRHSPGLTGESMFCVVPSISTRRGGRLGFSGIPPGMLQGIQSAPELL